MKAVTRSIRISPKKLNLIAELVRNKNANEALEMLDILPKKGAKIIRKTLNSAISNATNNFKQDANSLYIEEILVGNAPTFKRWLPASRGRMQPILKRNSHLSIKIGVKEEESKPASKKIAKKVEEKTPEKDPKKETDKTTKTIKA